MNKVYRVIWSVAQQSWVVASELVAKRGKGCGSDRSSSAQGAGADCHRAGLKETFASLAGSARTLLTSMVGSLTAALLGMTLVETASAGPAYKVGGGTYDSIYTDYYQYAFRTSSYAPIKAWDNQYALGSYVSIGAYASTAVNEADDNIFKLDGYAAGGRGGGVAVGDSASVVGETGVAIGAHAQALRNFSLALGGNSTANGLGSIAMGREALANGNYSVAQGFVATATGTGAIGLGQSATASGLRSIAIGTSGQLSSAGNTVADATYLNQATNAAGADAVSIGTGASTAANNSLALGVRAETTLAGTNGVAIGNGSKVSASNGIAIGNGSVASGVNSLSVGTGNQVSGSGSGAFGDPTTITGSNSYSVGNDNNISGSGSFVFGNTSVVQASNSALIGSNGSLASGQTDVFALGNNIISTVSNSVALGSNSAMISATGATTAGIGRYDSATVGGRTYTFAGSTPVGVVSVGSVGAERRVQNVAAGQLSATSTDAVNGSQLFATNQQTTENTDGINALGGRMTSAEGSIGGLQTRMTAAEVTAETHTGQIGSLLQDAMQWNAAIDAYDAGHGTAQSRKITNVAAGDLSAGSVDAVNGGQLFSTNQQIANNAASISELDGRVTTNEGDISSLQSMVDNISSGTIGLVQQSAAGENLTVGKDTDGLAVDFNGKAGARKLLNVADGNVASDSKEAVNGSQLFGVSQSVASAMGGGSVVNADGSISAPAYTVTNADGTTSTLSNVGDVISNIDSRTAQNTTDIAGNTASISDLDARVTDNTSSIGTINDQISSGTIGLVQQSAAGENLTVGKDTDGLAVDFKGKAGARKLVNVADGALASDSTEAVNGGQLFETNAKVAVIDRRMTNLEGSVMSLSNGNGIKYFHTNSMKVDSISAGADAIAAGGNAKASGVGSVAMGADSEAIADGSVALGSGASDGARGAESYSGKYSGVDNNSSGTLSVGNAATGESRTISNVADARQATDAVNLRQLDGAVAESKSYTDSKLDGVTGKLDNTIADVGNRVSKVEGDVGGVQNGTDGMFQVKNNQNLPKPKATGNNSAAGGAGAEAVADNSTAIGTNAKARGANSVAVGANSVAERDNSVAVGGTGTERQITHVAAGTERTDAANVGQVNDALTALSTQSNQRYNDLKKDISEQDDRLSAGIAGAIAIASLSQPIVNGGSTTAVGMGAYNGQGALSVGVSHMSNDGKWTTKVGGSADTQGRFQMGGSVGYNW